MKATRTAMAAENVYRIQGRVLTLPVVVRDARAGNAMFVVPAAALQSLLPDDAFEVVEMAAGEAQLVLGFVDYRDNDLGDYNEVMIAFFVRPKGAASDADGTFIYKLPVDQSFTCEAGRTIWGLPKTVEQIDIDYGDDRATCKLVMDGRHVFTLTLARGRAEAGDAADLQMMTYTYLDGPTAVPFTTGGTGTTVVPGPASVELTLGSHAIADQLRGLGLPKPALMGTWIEHMHGSFGAPRTLRPRLAARISEAPPPY